MRQQNGPLPQPDSAIQASVAAASRRAVALGARVVKEPVDVGTGMYQVHLDPAGHPFCFVMER